jgi:DNA-binding response OmpR family regulator
MENAKILLVDDDPDLTKSMQAVLGSAGYKVDIAASREEGMAKVRSEKPDLVILDVMMLSWNDGFEMSREMRQEDGLKNLPILMLTGVKGKTGIDFKSSAGDETWLPVDAFLDKPVEPDILVKKIKELLSKPV